MTTEKINTCKKLHEEYLALSAKTRLHIETYEPGKPLHPVHLKLDDLLRKEAVRKELLEECRDFLNENLTPEQLFDLENG